MTSSIRNNREPARRGWFGPGSVLWIGRDAGGVPGLDHPRAITEALPGENAVPIEVMMPKLSPTMESGVLSQWLVKVGDQVKEGDALADVETDKATMPMKAFDEGTVALLDRDVGDEIQLGERVLVLAKEGEDPAKVAEQYGGKKIYVARCQMSPYSPQKVDELLGGEKPAPKASPEARAPRRTRPARRR